MELNKFIGSGDSLGILELIRSHPELISKVPPGAVDYPDFHRIVDIKLKNDCYRICRQISANESLFLTRIDEALGTPGVPLWLEGEKLKEWAQKEEEDPSDEPTDWESYR